MTRRWAAEGASVFLWFSAIGCGLLGGLYFAFSTFIMRALASLAGALGAAAMNAINRDILRSLFMPLFFGTSLASVALAALALLDLAAPRSMLMLAGGIIYPLGMFVVTMAANVPLNNKLARAEGVGAVWADYLKRWTPWNHVRTLSSTLASGLFIGAIALT
jgi:uncharacterized membrane protein